MESRYDYIVVLGMVVRRDGTIRDILEGRLDRAAELYRAGASEKIILSGGATRHPYTVSEADVMHKYLTGLGIPSRALIKERRSFNTIANAVYTKMLISSRTKASDPSLLVVTSRYHAARSRLIFKRIFGPSCRLGFSIVPTPKSIVKKADLFEKLSMVNTRRNLEGLNERSSARELLAALRLMQKRGITTEMKKAFWY
jgi:uncharacterized SAM-binding protein YcdF (DUF218 family)